MVAPKAFIAIEQTMAAAMRAEWDRVSRVLMEQLHDTLVEGRWQDAHALADQLHLNGVVSEVRARIEELAVASLLFGAHHVTGSVSQTGLAQGGAVPIEMHQAIDQLVAMIEQGGADYVRKQLHAAITALAQSDETAHFQKGDARAEKEDLEQEDLQVAGGLQEPEQGRNPKKKRAKKGSGRTLYARRPLANAEELIAWAHTQGFKHVQQPEDMLVTLCYSKTPFDWWDIEPNQNQVKVLGGERHIQLFGDGDVVVLEIVSDELTAEHEALRAAGASYDFDTYRPHVSLSWEGVPRPIEELEPYRGPLVFGPQIFQEIDGGWREDHDEVELRKAEATLAEKLNEAVRTGGNVAIDIGANLTTSRLISLGFLAEAVRVGVDTYQINEILDAKTCSVCRYMHGKVFSVQQEYGRVLQCLSTSDPQELRSIAPWPKQSKAGLQTLFGLSSKELQTSGYGSPPYHPGCRGFIVMTGHTEEEIPIGGGDLAFADTGGLQLPSFETMLGTAWTAERIAALGDALPSIADETLRLSAQAAFDAKDFERALQLAESATAPLAATGATWSAAAIEQLKWERFQITDPALFKIADDAFQAGDYAAAQKTLTEWLGGETVQKGEETDGVEKDPFAPKKKKKPQQAAGQGQEMLDVGAEGELLMQVETQNLNGAPLMRN